MRAHTLAILAMAIPATLHAQTEETAFQSALGAWEQGDFISALEVYQDLLQGSNGEQWVEQVAAATGEVYRVEELAPDGRAIRFSYDGKYASYESGEALFETTHVVRIEDLATVATLRGRSFRFAPDGNWGVFLTVTESQEITDVQETIRVATQARDRQTAGRARMQLRQAVAKSSTLTLVDLESGQRTRLNVQGTLVYDATFGSDHGTVFFTGQQEETVGISFNLFRMDVASEDAEQLTNTRGLRLGLQAVPGDRYMLYRRGNRNFTLLDIESGEEHSITGVDESLAADGSAVVYSVLEDSMYFLKSTDLSGDLSTLTLVQSDSPIRYPRYSPDGTRITYQRRVDGNYDVFVANSEDSSEVRITNHVQHDIFPRFVTDTHLLTVRGEGRHRRSFLHDLSTGATTKLFHNNTVRTIAPEYEWAVSPDGSKILIVSERDGDTVSPERGVYLLYLDQRVGHAELVERIQDNLASEIHLREIGEAMFAPVARTVEEITTEVSPADLYEYQERMFSFGSKYITQPGNAMAIEYLAETLRRWGYEPELQWFEPRDSIRTANVIVTLPGIVHPDVTYVVSSHFDSVSRGPGADDNTSGTSVLLETARLLADHPLSATVKFAFFTGEEAGLLGSREFMRRAVADSLRIVGALNNDMVGWSGDGRIDNTIRYSNAGIRDLQHAAALLFSDLITYDAKYYKFTDAHAYYEVYGDIVGGIGSYPVLGNPNYHQASDRLPTIDQDLIVATTKTNIASIMLLASSPSRINGLRVTRRRGNSADITWDPAPEADIAHYLVTYGPVGEHARRELSTTTNEVTIEDVPPGTGIFVRAVNNRGMNGWDWARITLD